MTDWVTYCSLATESLHDANFGVIQGLALLQRSDTVASLTANGWAVFFNESWALIGWKACDSVRSLLSYRPLVAGSHNANPQCHRWWQSWHHDNFWYALYIVINSLDDRRSFGLKFGMQGVVTSWGLRSQFPAFRYFSSFCLFVFLKIMKILATCWMSRSFFASAGWHMLNYTKGSTFASRKLDVPEIAMFVPNRHVCAMFVPNRHVCAKSIKCSVSLELVNLNSLELVSLELDVPEIAMFVPNRHVCAMFVPNRHVCAKSPCLCQIYQTQCQSILRYILMINF